MKKRICSLLCALAIVITLPALTTSSEAAINASDYISYTDVRAYAEGGGWILIEIDVEATHIMQRVGASEVFIYEQQSDGYYDNVYTFTSGNWPYLLEANSICAYLDVNYKGKPGVNYYAYVGCYARDINGSETLYFSSNVVTA